MDTLAKLLGGAARIRLLRLFMFNPDQVYDRDDVVRRIRTSSAVGTRELTALVRMGLLKKTTFSKEVETGKGANKKTIKKKVPGYTIDTQSDIYEALREFLFTAAPISHAEILKELRTSGRLRMVVLSGFFMNDWERRLDILIVGDKIRESTLAQAIHHIESTLGRELHYTCLTVDDFRFRYSVQDRLIRDVFDYEHEVILDQMGMR